MKTAPLFDFDFLSYGGGTQSAALGLMSCMGVLPRVDAIIMADTQGELPETYDFAEYMKEKAYAAEIPFVVVTAGSLEEALLSPVPTMSNPTPPAHVLNKNGSKGRIGQYRCSYDFKRRIIVREVKRRCGKPGAWKRSLVNQWMGFSTDEIGRCKQSNECRCGHMMAKHEGGPCACGKCDAFDRWQINTFPLIEMGFRREDTISWFGKNGHPTPPRSACFFCPNSSNVRWARLKADHPDLWERACHLDEHNRNGGGFNARGNVAFEGQMFWHSSLDPLREADLRSAHQITVDAGQGTMFDEAVLTGDCEAGVCFT